MTTFPLAVFLACQTALAVRSTNQLDDSKLGHDAGALLGGPSSLADGIPFLNFRKKNHRLGV